MEKLRFEVRTAYDQRALAVGQKVLEYRDPALRAKIRNIRLVLCGFGGMIFGLGGMSLGGALPVAVTVLLMAVGLLIASVGIFYHQVARFGFRKVVTGEIEVARFGEEGFSLHSPSREEEHPYSDLLGLYRKGRYLFLFVRLETGYVVDERGVQNGTAEALEAFLKEKTGKDIVKVR